MDILQLKGGSVRFSHLHKHSEEDDGDDGGQKHVLHGKVITGQQERQREGDCAPQAPVRHNELIFTTQLHHAVLINDVR